MTTERELFEAWFVRDYHPNSLQPMEGGCYLNRGAGMAWDAWQAARTQPATPDKLRDVLQLGLDAAEQVLTERKQALAGYPHKWRIEQEAVDTIRAALAAPAQQGEPPVVPATPMWDEDQIARACANADLPDSLCESLLMALDDLDQFAAAPQPLPPTVQQARQPLTDEQRHAMWKVSNFRGNGGQIDWFIEGTRAAEIAHGITGEQP